MTETTFADVALYHGHSSEQVVKYNVLAIWLDYITINLIGNRVNLKNNKTMFSVKIWLVLLSALMSFTASAQTTTDYSFESISKFDDRDNALRIIGMEKDTGMPLNILLYQYDNRERAVRGYRPNCMSYIQKMMDQPGEYIFNISVVLRADPNIFAGADVVRGCGLETNTIGDT